MAGRQDFRSEGGLYQRLRGENRSIVAKGQDVFSARALKVADERSVLLRTVAELKEQADAAEPSPTHKFLKRLDEEKRLLRVYTQNVDDLERKAGLSSSTSASKYDWDPQKTRVIAYHGTVHKVRCEWCSAQYDLSPEFLGAFRKGEQPTCVECADAGECEERGQEENQG